MSPHEEFFDLDAFEAREQERLIRRQKREAERRAAGRRLLIRAAVFLAAIAVLITVIVAACSSGGEEAQPQDKSSPSQTTAEKKDEPKADPLPLDSGAEAVADKTNSRYVAVINCDENTVVAARSLHERMYPASTTKIMTALVAYESKVSLDSTFTMTAEIIDPLYRQEATLAGFADGESVTLRDLIYGTVMPSGAEAAEGCAILTAGSVEAFVEKMNERVASLGLKNTHFTNVTGLHDEQNYSTAYDIAVILREAIKVPFLREVFSAYQYTTAPTAIHPEGIPLTGTLFSYMYGTEPDGAQILGGKTGYVNESGYCIASFGKSDTGHEYICVTGFGDSRWPAVYDQIDLYTAHAK